MFYSSKLISKGIRKNCHQFQVRYLPDEDWLSITELLDRSLLFLRACEIQEALQYSHYSIKCSQSFPSCFLCLLRPQKPVTPFQHGLNQRSEIKAKGKKKGQTVKRLTTEITTEFWFAF